MKAQTSFWKSSKAFIGQKLPGDKPEIFAKGLLEDGGIALDRVAFSPDGKEFYYCHALHWFESKGATIRYFKFDNGKWNGPVVLNEGYYAPSFSTSNDSIYFIGGGMQGVVWKSARTATGWTKPVQYIKASYGLYDFMKTQSGLMYIGSNGNQGNIKDFSTYDFCQLAISGTDTTIKKLDGPVNTEGFDGDFFVSNDESYIIISTNETKEYESELFISFRNADKSWSTPKSLGPLVNNGKAHRWGQYVTPDNKYLFYTQGTSEKDCHIYWMRFDYLLRLLKNET
ncbi:hypothetical protein GS399_03805 [Pedobacter sp. HMF7647]|uniref:Uncharacterized protein n=1 Tax=Hufsiella arboris TaxID=2695275 RepID=A0A7K1Y686_9SPHI|nr:hypothetical protein [Hufsiella arboris]MXV50085.1 hypothetical protein [Hufsiella arboris]